MRTALAALTLAIAASGALAASPQRAKPPQPAAPPAVQAAPALTPEEIVQRANAYLNGLDSLTADFVQVSPGNKRFTGRLYVQRPGRIRFDYDAPAALEIVGDGQNVVVRDRKLATASVYPVSQTPLTFLLQANIDIARDLKLTGAARSEGGTYVSFESSSTFVGTSRVAVFFDDDMATLRGWRVIDTQGQHTVVTLADIDRTPIQDFRTFDIRFQSQQR